MKIIFEQEKCIGCGSCAAICPKFWKIDENGKSNLINSKLNPKTNNFELEIDKINCNQEAADSCPVQCISIVKP